MCELVDSGVLEPAVSVNLYQYLQRKYLSDGYA